ncbi:hypothetical protein GM661_00395 [Iocasia frigidifontis]|uniref:Phage conserved hypothetical protein C-terminal domain-containing protein n=2 Tax=Iocasia fonsfrigidae TaxID=2682810 RepID=A0A8A7KJU2_9FIRM|nr:hypothetical protein GM661_00395 [Iocasia fonsfrigidae]
MILFPLDNIDIDEIENWTNILKELGKLIPYSFQKKDYYYIKNFHKHQSLRSPGKPELPLPKWIEYIPNPKPYQSGGYIINYEIMPGEYEGIQTVGNVDEALYKGNGDHKEALEEPQENHKDTVRKPYGYHSPTNKNKKENKNIELEKDNIYSPAKKEQDSASEKIPYAEIVDYLNQKCGTQYRNSTKKTQELIRARWNEGFKLEAFKTVIDKKSTEWLNDENAKYLRPVTLFGTKFESYLNQLTAKNKSSPGKTNVINFDKNMTPEEQEEYYRSKGYR